MRRGMVIVGAGECGARAAIALRENGYTGPVTLIGEEPHAPYERPPLSKHAMMSRTPEAATIVTKEALRSKDIVLITLNPANAIDRGGRSLLLGDGRSIPYEKLLLATGAEPRRLAVPGDAGRIAYLRTLDDAVTIRRHLLPGARIAIIGGGFIGLEVAATARRLGTEVTVIEAQPRILMRGVPAEIATTVHALHVSEGVAILCGIGIASLTEGPAGIRVEFSGGQAIHADLVVIGIGALPRIALAETAGLEIDNGIKVDATLRTSEPDIYAAGDCCSFPLSIYGGRRVRLESWRNAQEQGALAAQNMLGTGKVHEAVPWFWSDHYASTLHIAGLADEGTLTVRRVVGPDAFILFHLADGRLVAASSFGPGNSLARDIRLAEFLIARGACPDPESLAAPDFKLKAMLAA